MFTDVTFYITLNVDLLDLNLLKGKDALVVYIIYIIEPEIDEANKKKIREDTGKRRGVMNKGESFS